MALLAAQPAPCAGDLLLVAGVDLLDAGGDPLLAHLEDNSQEQAGTSVLSYDRTDLLHATRMAYDTVAINRCVRGCST
ncbi:hypothetical protein ACFVU4_32210 [Streptomyces sp. NPDC058107]|uniref:hypothetical protein n=1 Tax=Streptomyces sp. NPDC058107 TaxID=3346343 RepID=UPI0036E999BE